MGAVHALIDNAAGQTAVQALAAGLPVIGYRPLPGHGEEGVRRMAGLGVSEFAPDEAGLLSALERVLDAGPSRTCGATAAAPSSARTRSPRSRRWRSRQRSDPAGLQEARSRAGSLGSSSRRASRWSSNHLPTRAPPYTTKPTPMSHDSTMRTVPTAP